MQAEDLLRAGQIEETLVALEGQVRANPADAKLRVFLFQLLSVMGDWNRALNQLNVAAELDAMNLLMAQVCRTALACEALRAEVFSGQRSPLIFGQPDEWVGLLVQANRMISEAKYDAASRLREQAFDAAPATAGTIDGEAFEWIADADSRLGPVLETIVEGKYYWVPFAAIRQVQIEAPADLRDLVWLPAHLTWVNGGEAFGLIPSRYPGSGSSEDHTIRLARKTEWAERPGEAYFGLGQRVLATDKGEFPLLQVRHIELDQPPADPPDSETNDG